jgi:hypothetical protein
MARIVHVASFAEVWKTIRRHEYGRGVKPGHHRIYYAGTKTNEKGKFSRI